ncbi:MAG: hypothetical protein QXT58_04665 [Archaeoglobaceae archaeon]
MPSRWMHCVVDLIAFGRTYPEIHAQRDEPYKRLGAKHRIERHGLYQFCKKHREPFENLLPFLMECFEDLRNSQGGDKSEEAQVDAAHNRFDYLWDEFSTDERKYFEGLFAWIVLHPEILMSKFGVDVIGGRIHRVLEDGNEVWEDAPEVIQQYNELRKEVGKRLKEDDGLRAMLMKYG